MCPDALCSLLHKSTNEDQRPFLAFGAPCSCGRGVGEDSRSHGHIEYDSRGGWLDQKPYIDFWCSKDSVSWHPFLVSCTHFSIFLSCFLLLYMDTTEETMLVHSEKQGSWMSQLLGGEGGLWLVLKYDEDHNGCISSNKVMASFAEYQGSVFDLNLIPSFTKHYGWSLGPRFIQTSHQLLSWWR